MEETDGEILARLGTDGEAWAHEWLRKNPLGLKAITEDDLETMRAWFANAIEAGRSAGYVRGANDEARRHQGTDADREAPSAA